MGGGGLAGGGGCDVMQEVEEDDEKTEGVDDDSAGDDIDDSTSEEDEDVDQGAFQAFMAECAQWNMTAPQVEDLDAAWRLKARAPPGEGRDAC